MKKRFTIWIPDDEEIEALQLAIALKNENDKDNARGVTLFQATPEDLKNKDWLFRHHSKAEPVKDGEV